MKFLLLLLLALTLSASAAPSEAFFKALHQVETGGRLGATIGDKGAALGPLQIHRIYFVDSGIKDGCYEDCADLEFSKRVVSAYAKKYEPRAWRDNDVVVLARLHNGGPRWAKKPSTIAYSKKLLKFLK